jgi:thioredoxin reductase (NADPH)
LLVSTDLLIIYNVYDQHLILYFTVDGAGCMAALDAEHYLQEVGAQEGKSD